MRLQIKRIHSDAVVPSCAHEGDAGFDLCASEPVTVQSGDVVQVPTGIALEIPEGYVGLIWDKSGLAQKKRLKTLGGVIDSGYRGEVFVGIVNLGDASYTFEVGDKVAQMLIQKVEVPKIVEVDELNDSERGEKGFGSTGK